MSRRPQTARPQTVRTRTARTGRIHPGAWWLWAIGVAAAASRTTNPILLGLLAAIVSAVVLANRPVQRDGVAFSAFVVFAALVLAVRLLFQILFGATVPGATVLIRLPEVVLPDWAPGVRIGGPVTIEGIVLAFYDGLRLAVILLALGAANVLGDARRLLRSLPAALYEVGVALVVTLTFAPRLAEDVARVRRARRLRGGTSRPVRDLPRIAVPVLEHSLDNAIDLAAAMDARGFGRRAAVPDHERRTSNVLLLLGLVGGLAGLYGLLGTGSPAWLGGSLLLCGVGSAAVSLHLAGRRCARTRYRPDPWGRPEWVIVAAGALAGAAFAWLAGAAAPGLDLLVVPLVVPDAPALAVGAAATAGLPAWLRPPSAAAVAADPVAVGGLARTTT